MVWEPTGTGQISPSSLGLRGHSCFKEPFRGTQGRLRGGAVAQRGLGIMLFCQRLEILDNFLPEGPAFSS